MENVQKYIKLIKSMYSIPKDKLALMDTNAALMAEELKYYTWDDIKHAVEIYYAKKNDKTYPKLAQITAILNVNGKRRDLCQIEAKRPPQTNLRGIKDIYLDVLRILHEQGVRYVDYFADLPFGNKSIIRNGKIWNKEWDWEDGVLLAKQNYPQEFAKYGRYRLSKCEEFALAYKLGCAK